MHQSTCLFICSHSPTSLFVPSTSYSIRSRVNRCPYSSVILTYCFFFLSFIFISSTKVSQSICWFLFHIHLFHFFFFNFIFDMKWSESICWFIFLHSSIPFLLRHSHIRYEVDYRSKTICLFICSHSPTSLFVPSTSYSIWSEVNQFANSFSYIHLFHFFFVILIFDMKLTSKTICWFIRLHSPISFWTCLQLHIRYEVKWINLLVHSCVCIQLLIMLGRVSFTFILHIKLNHTHTPSIVICLVFFCLDFSSSVIGRRNSSINSFFFIAYYLLVVIFEQSMMTMSFVFIAFFIQLCVKSSSFICFPFL